MHNRPIYDEVELVSLLKNRDQQAFTYLYDQYAAAVYCLILQIVRNEQTASKVLHDVFVTTSKKIDAYDAAKGRLFIWLIQLARAAALEQHNRKSAENITVDLKKSVASINHVVVDDHGLKKLTIQLNDEQRDLIDLVYFHGHTIDQIAGEMSIPVNLVKKKIRTALSELRNLLHK